MLSPRILALLAATLKILRFPHAV